MTSTRPFVGSLPAYHTIIEAAAGEIQWTAAELAARDASPPWLIAEAQAQLELAMLKQSGMARAPEMRSAIELVRKLPDKKMQRTVFRLLNTYLTKEDRIRFRRIFHESEKGGRRKTLVRGLIAASILLVAVYAYNYSARTITAVAAAEIESHGAVVKNGEYRSELRDIYSDEKFNYQATIATALKRAWLINMNDNPANIQVYSESNRTGVIHFDDTLDEEARNCFEYFIVIVANGDAIPDTNERRLWLYVLRTELQQYTPENDPDKRLAEQAIDRHLKASGFEGGVKIHVDRFRRHHGSRQ
jgi:hypothetical protein